MIIISYDDSTNLKQRLEVFYIKNTQEIRQEIKWKFSLTKMRKKYANKG